MITSKLRGCTIYLKDKVWYYVEDNSPVTQDVFKCGHCGKANTKEGHDGCLGTLKGIRNACCGHGEDEAYLQFADMQCIRGAATLKIIDRVKR